MAIGRKPIVRSSKLHHTGRTVVERQELAPPEPGHARWRVELGRAGTAAMVAGVIAASASAQAAPGDPGGAQDGGSTLLGPTPATEVALAPTPDPIDVTAPRLGVRANKAVESAARDAIAFGKVPTLKEDPYVPTREAKKARIVRKARKADADFGKVEALKANPYD